MLFKEGLLISDMAFYAANWAVIAVLGAIGGATVVVKRWQRWGVAGGCASIGTFLVFLGVDLAMNRQSGMSRGLRFLFDRNSNHIVDIITTGYIPPISTQILLGASLGTTLLFAWAQHHFFRAHPFLPNRPEPRYTDPTMGRYTAEPESIYMENSTADLLAAPLPPSTSNRLRAKDRGASHGRESRSDEEFGCGVVGVSVIALMMIVTVPAWGGLGEGGGCVPGACDEECGGSEGTWECFREDPTVEEG
ncbi:hypothetical protein FA13DRAFT_1779468 [Coprinellus micaceus]|uniref:DUF4203 domain-containing protein n=1 Tax=Coprinellus micaceus TaxID=71717 RepID=A0A4Y7SHV9_COPMI|nr:hypothetical protein FA13DRAFT_1779468 [Coprinellus micaceus]